MSKKQEGFSLIELLIVVAIILIIAAIAIPNLLRSRMAANEASAVGSLRTINTAEVTYFSTYGVGYSPADTNLGGVPGAAATCAAAGLLDPVLAPAAPPIQKSGYSFTFINGTVAATVPAGSACAPGWADGYVITAVPINVGTTGQRSFCTDASGVVRFDPTGAAPANAPPLCSPALQALQ
jgi:type IV pilus assembly protein PilA